MSEESKSNPTPTPTPEVPHSPTGTPIIPPVVAKWAAPICLVAGMLVMEGPELGLVLPAAALPWIKFVWVLGSVFGIVSPGARKP